MHASAPHAHQRAMLYQYVRQLFSVIILLTGQESNNKGRCAFIKRLTMLSLSIPFSSLMLEMCISMCVIIKSTMKEFALKRDKKKYFSFVHFLCCWILVWSTNMLTHTHTHTHIERETSPQVSNKPNPG